MSSKLYEVSVPEMLAELRRRQCSFVFMCSREATPDDVKSSAHKDKPGLSKMYIGDMCGPIDEILGLTKMLSVQADLEYASFYMHKNRNHDFPPD